MKHENELPLFLREYKQVVENIRYFRSLGVWSTRCLSENGQPLELTVEGITKLGVGEETGSQSRVARKPWREH